MASKTTIAVKNITSLVPGPINPIPEEATREADALPSPGI